MPVFPSPGAKLTIERERLVWHPQGATEPLVISLADIFSRL